MKMTFRNVVTREWHNLCAGFYHTLFESCLDEAKRAQLYRKVFIHKHKATRSIQTASASVKAS